MLLEQTQQCRRWEFHKSPEHRTEHPHRRGTRAQELKRSKIPLEAILLLSVGHILKVYHYMAASSFYLGLEFPIAHQPLAVMMGEDKEAEILLEVNSLFKVEGMIFQYFRVTLWWMFVKLGGTWWRITGALVVGAV